MTRRDLFKALLAVPAVLLAPWKKPAPLVMFTPKYYSVSVPISVADIQGLHGLPEWANDATINDGYMGIPR